MMMRQAMTMIAMINSSHAILPSASMIPPKPNRAIRRIKMAMIRIASTVLSGVQLEKSEKFASG